MNKLPLKNLLTLYDSGTWGDEGDKSNLFPVLRSTNIKMYKMIYNNTAYMQIPEKDKVRKLLQDGDILVTKSSGSPDLIGKCAIFISPKNNSKYYFSNFMLRLRPNEEILCSKWLYFFLLSPIGKAVIQSMNSTTSGLRNLSLTYYLSQEIPVPPLPEQKRIADILDKADSVRQKRKESIALLDEFLKSVFIDMFGDPVRNERGWKNVKVIDVCNCIVPGRNKPKSFTGKINWITTDDLINLGITNYSKKNLALSEDEIKEVGARIIPKDSVLLTCVGDLGITSIAGNNIVINQQLHSFQCSNKINNIFLMFNLNHQKLYMYKMASSTTLPYMNKTNCNSIPIILPPITLQTQFTKIVEQVEATKSKMEESLREMDNQFNSLLQRAFKNI